jgi:HAD superfamily hydrolase (TIGR01662 family)
MSIKLVIFDNDGVLIDSYYAWKAAYGKGFEKSGFKIPDKDYKEWFGIPFTQAYMHFVSKDKKEAEEANKKVNDYFGRHFGNIKVFEGVTATIKELAGRGIKVGILSNCNKRVVEKIIKIKGIHHDFLAAPPEVRLKPDPEGLFKIMKKAGVSKNETIFIGDAGPDLEAGKNAGVRTLIIGKDIKKVGDILKLI